MEIVGKKILNIFVVTESINIVGLSARTILYVFENTRDANWSLLDQKKNLSDHERYLFFFSEVRCTDHCSLSKRSSRLI